MYSLFTLLILSCRIPSPRVPIWWFCWKVYLPSVEIKVTSRDKAPATSGQLPSKAMILTLLFNIINKTHCLLPSRSKEGKERRREWGEEGEQIGLFIKNSINNIMALKAFTRRNKGYFCVEKVDLPSCSCKIILNILTYCKRKSPSMLRIFINAGSWGMHYFMIYLSLHKIEF